MILVWAYKEFQKGKGGNKGWNDEMIDWGLKEKKKQKKKKHRTKNNNLYAQSTSSYPCGLDWGRS
jgi:hypothetical protein